MENSVTKKPWVTVILPAYNEAAMVGQTVGEIKKLHPDFEVLVVDDGSTDATMQMAIEAGANVWPHPYNMGNGAAVKSGLRAARGEYVILMDADGQHAAADIAKLLEHAETFDMVVGARTLGSETAWHRDIANTFFNIFASYVTKFRVEDLTSGFRLVKTSVAQQFIYLLPNTFSYPSTLTMAYLRSGRSIHYTPVKTRARKGKSKIKPIEDGVRFFLIITKVATLYTPFRVFLPVSLFFFLLGLGYYAYTFFTQGRFTNMSALFLSTAVMTFLIGLISEQISQIHFYKTK
jgi:glycosyltransferase involved in cell wall biosynthesis